MWTPDLFRDQSPTVNQQSEEVACMMSLANVSCHVRSFTFALLRRHKTVCPRASLHFTSFHSFLALVINIAHNPQSWSFYSVHLKQKYLPDPAFRLSFRAVNIGLFFLSLLFSS